MVDVRRIVVIFVIAALFAIFVQAAIEMVYPAPRYEDYCRNEFGPKSYPVDAKNVSCPATPQPTPEEDKSCTDSKGFIDYEYLGMCPTKYFCNTCDNDLRQVQDQHDFVLFLISSVLGLVAIAIGLYLPLKNELNEWIGSGFMLGGLFTLFFGTAVYYMKMGRFVRPAILLAELLIVIYISYKKLSKKDKDVSIENKN